MSEGAGGVTPGGGCDRKCFHCPTLVGGQILTQPPAAGVRAEKQLGLAVKAWTTGTHWLVKGVIPTVVQHKREEE